MTKPGRPSGPGNPEGPSAVPEPRRTALRVVEPAEGTDTRVVPLLAPRPLPGGTVAPSRTAYRPVELRLPEAPIPAALPVFTTVKVLDLGCLKRVVKRRLGGKTPPTDLEAHQRLNAALEELFAARGVLPPEVIVVEWPEQGAINLQSAILGNMIVLAASLSPRWEDTALSEAAKLTLERHLRTYLATRTGQAPGPAGGPAR